MLYSDKINIMTNFVSLDSIKVSWDFYDRLNIVKGEIVVDSDATAPALSLYCDVHRIRLAKKGDQYFCSRGDVEIHVRPQR